MDNYHFFNIDFVSVNLFSFVMGVVWSFFNQGLFGKKIALPIFIYFASLASWYGFQNYIYVNNIHQPQQPQQLQNTNTNTNNTKEIVGLNGTRWTVSDTLPPRWNVSEEQLNKSMSSSKP